LPSITLPDAEDHPFSTASLKGKYYLIDFWSTWCPQCVAYSKAKVELRKLFPPERFEMVSVAMDAEREDWEKELRRLQPSWQQLIDTAMWQGVAARTLKFDSIPFNFLVDPQGRILRKGIPPDSLAAAVANALAR
jgi:thiol-disulfide isomerase/thioredoxin